MFMLGGYAGYVAYHATGSFSARGGGRRACSCSWSGCCSNGRIIRRFYERPAEDQILLTFGLGIVIVELVRLVFGSLSKQVPPPTWAAGITPLGFMIYPTYRIVVMGSPRSTLRCSTWCSIAPGSA